MTDGELLEHFLRQDDQTAFAALVRMHGGLVFGVCRRILGNHHDAEEAFQAAFLVLARKASSLKGRASLAGWLHEAAQRTAQNAKRLRARRQIREQQVEPMSELTAVAPKDAQEIMPYVDEELSRLPEKYRLAIVLCDLEGNSQPEAARKVGCPLGTMSGWLTRGREMLRKRLIRRGLSVSSGMLVMALSQQAASASVPASLVSSTAQMASVWATSSAVTAGVISPYVAALTEGVLKTMLFSTLKNVVMALSVIAIVGLSAGGLIYQMHGAEPREKAQELKNVMEKLQGEWKVVKFAEGGKEDGDEKLKAKKPMITFRDQKVMQRYVGSDGSAHSVESSLKINVTKQPFEMDWTNFVEISPEQPNGRELPILMEGIFEFDDQALKIHIRASTDGKDFNGNPAKRPTDFQRSDAGCLGDVLMTLQRVKP